MELKTIFTHITKSNHTIDVVKSAIQKYARRGNAKIMFGAVTEMDAFKTLGKDNQKVKAIRTNMINRLAVILFEDVSFSQLITFTNVIKLIKAWEQSERSESSLLMEICCEIAEAKKLRFPSHLRNTYFGPSNATKEDFLAMLKSGKHTDAFGWLYNNEKEAAELLSSWIFAFDETKEVVDFALAKWKKIKNPAEKFTFLVVPYLWILHNIEENIGEYTAPKHIEEYEKAYDDTNIVFEEFVYDMHTNKSQKVFLEDVENEDTQYLDKDLKQRYKQQPTKKKIPHSMADIPEMDLGEVELITDKVCGNKLPCGITTIKGKKVVVKPMPKTMNYGADYEYIDAQKKSVGLRPLRVIRVISPKAITGTKKTGFEWKETPQVFAVMKYIKDEEDLGKKKELLKKRSHFKEALKIRLFNGIFRSSDNIIRNILVDKDNQLYAIDENDVLGKRKNVFNKTEPMKKSELLTKELVKEVLLEMNLEENKQKMLDELEEYNLGHHKAELGKRIDEYENIIMKELNL